MKELRQNSGMRHVLSNATYNAQRLVILFNIGLHIHNPEEYELLLRATILPFFLSFRDRGQIVAFRETAAQHFLTPMGL